MLFPQLPLCCHFRYSHPFDGKNTAACSGKRLITALTQWVRPPDINLNGVTMPANALQVNAANASININFNLAIR